MLEGLRVVEMATYIAAPAAGGIMADWGAEVIKVEAPGGDPIRQFFAGTRAEDIGNPVFDLDNRGKRSIMIDIKTDEGAAAMRKLVSTADVFITNVRPSALERAGLDFASLHKDHPELIFASVTGYGLEGPERDRPGMDMAAFWARSGMAHLFQRKGYAPLPMRVAVGDHTTALALVSGILGAVIERQKTGEGRLVEASLLRTGIYCLGSDMAIQQRLGRVASTRERNIAPDPMTNIYQTQDEKWLVLLNRQGTGGGDWDKLVELLEIPADKLADEMFATKRDRMKNNGDTIAMLDAGFGSFTMEELSKRLDAADIIWAPVKSTYEVVDDAQAHASGAFTEMPMPDGTMSATISTPVEFHGADNNPKGPSPEPGQHGREILAALGYSDDELDKMQAAGALK